MFQKANGPCHRPSPHSQCPHLGRLYNGDLDILFWGENIPPFVQEWTEGDRHSILGNTRLRERPLKLDASCSVSIALMLARILRNGFYSEKAYLENITPRLKFLLMLCIYIRFRFAKLTLLGLPGVLSKEEGRRKKRGGGGGGGGGGEKPHGKQRKE